MKLNFWNCQSDHLEPVFCCSGLDCTLSCLFVPLAKYKSQRNHLQCVAVQYNTSPDSELKTDYRVDATLTQ